MTLPNFLIVGAQKCGTTSLHDILDKHPQTSMSSIKEVNYFVSKKKYQKGLDHYSMFFDGHSEAVAIGESSPGYICYPGVHERIKENLGVVKIVIILRDPIKRAFSQYWDNRRHLSETLTETEIISRFLESEYVPGRRGYFSRGVYYTDVKKYINTFGEENVHVVILENLVKEQTMELQKLYSFLNLDPSKGAQDLPVASNSSVVWENFMYNYFFKNPYKTRFLPTKARRLLFFGKQVPYKYKLPDQYLLNTLKEFYHPWNKKLEKLLNINLNVWL